MSLECNVYKADVHTLCDLVTLESECFDKPWSESAIKADLIKDNAYYIVGGIDVDVVGYAGIYISFDEADITRICVSPKYRRKGIAKALLSALVDYCSTNSIRLLHLDVKATNTPAIELYKSFGFTEDCVRKRYYSDGTDAILMTKGI